MPTIVIDTAKLRVAFQRVLSTVPTRSPKPVLSYVLWAGDALGASDQEAYVSEHVDFLRHPDVMLPAHQFAAILSIATSDQIKLEILKAKVKIVAGGRTWTLPTCDSTDWPVFPDARPIATLQVSAATLCEAIRGTSFACDVTSSRFALGGVALLSIDGKAYLAGTDGRRLSRVPLGVSHSGAAAIVPKNYADRISKLLDNLPGDCQVRVGASRIEIECAGTTISVPLLEGRFPNIDGMCDAAAYSLEATMLAADIEAALRAVRVTSNKQSRGVEFAQHESQLVLSSVAEIGESQAELPVNGSIGKTMLDGTMLAEYLATLPKGAQVTLRTTPDGEGPTIWLCGDRRFVLMPMSSS